MNQQAADRSGAGVTAWTRYNNELNPRDRRMSEAWVLRLRQWLKENGVGPTSVLLDFGCGYFDLGIAFVGEAAQVDGFDVNPDAVAVARRRTEGRSDVALYSARDVIPVAAYDVIVANSVLQYFGSLAEVDEFVRFAAVRMKSGSSMLVLSDVIPARFSSVRDGLDSLLFAARNGLLRPMARHLIRAASMPRGLGLLRIAPEAMAQMARAHGLVFERLPENLTPSKVRYSCILRRRN